LQPSNAFAPGIGLEIAAGMRTLTGPTGFSVIGKEKQQMHNHNRFLILVLIVASLMSCFGGCQDPKEKYPDFPQWGWWDRPARPAEPEDSQTGDAEAEKPSEQTQPKDKLTGQDLEEYREKVWPEVSVLRDTDEMTAEDRDKTLTKARENIAQWYRPMPVDPPDVTKPGWTTIAVWDFMLEEEFVRASNTWRNVAEKQNVEFPNVVTRRNLMQFIKKMVNGELTPQPRTQPTNKKEG